MTGSPEECARTAVSAVCGSLAAVFDSFVLFASAESFFVPADPFDPADPFFPAVSFTALFDAAALFDADAPFEAAVLFDAEARFDAPVLFALPADFTVSLSSPALPDLPVLLFDAFFDRVA